MGVMFEDHTQVTEEDIKKAKEEAIKMSKKMLAMAKERGNLA